MAVAATKLVLQLAILASFLCYALAGKPSLSILSALSAAVVDDLESGVSMGDTATLAPRDQWYHAAQHIDYWVEFGREWTGLRDLHGLDAYSGPLGRTAAAMRKRGFQCETFDICRGGKAHDVTTATGFKALVLLALRLMPFALLMLGPPCSMMVYFSSSQHMRHLFGAEGCPWDFLTQLSNLIASNTAALVKIIKAVRTHDAPWVVLEQPKGSWLPKLPSVSDMISTCQLQKVLTYLCFFGHDLEKGTWLFGNLPGMNALKRFLSKQARAKYADMRARKNQRRKEPKVYYVKTDSGRVHGAKLMAQTATYPTRFCTELIKIWVQAAEYAKSANSAANPENLVS